MNSASTANPPAFAKKALLVFADALSRDLGRRRWSSALAPLLAGRNLDMAEASGAAGCDVHVFGAGLAGLEKSVPGVARHAQRGGNFAERLENAVAALRGQGYEQIVVIGDDCPELDAGTVSQAFAALETSPAVLGPDHRGGCYLIGFHADGADALRGVDWQKNKDFAALSVRFGAESVAVLPVRVDVDSLADVRLLAASAVESVAALAARLLAVIEGLWEIFLGAGESIAAFLARLRVQWQLPPPALV